MNRYFLSVVLLLVFSANSFSADTPQQQKLLVDGEASLAKENYLEAIEAYEKYLSEPPQDKVDYALFSLGKAKYKLADGTPSKQHCIPDSHLYCSTDTLAQIRYAERYPQDFSPMECCDGTYLYSNKEFKRLEIEFPRSPYTAEGAFYLKNQETFSADADLKPLISYIDTKTKYIARYPKASWSIGEIESTLCIYAELFTSITDAEELITPARRAKTRHEADAFYKKVIPLLSRAVSSTDLSKKEQALDGIACMLPLPHKLITILKLAQSDKSPAIQNKAKTILKLAKQNNIPALANAIHSISPEVRIDSAKTLYAIQLSSKIVLPTVLSSLEAKSPSVRYTAMWTLSMMGSPLPDAIPGLIKVLHDQDKKNRVAAANTLGIVGKGSEEARSALREAIQNPSLEIVMEATAALRKISPEDFERHYSSTPSQTIVVTIDPSRLTPGSIRRYLINEKGEKIAAD